MEIKNRSRSWHLIISLSSLDYIENLGGPYGNKIFWITWDIVVTEINGGWGMFFIRFPTVNNSMQILFGFMDDGRLIRFSGPPAVDMVLTDH